MSAPHTEAPRAADQGGDPPTSAAAAGPRVLPRTVHAEWTKLRTMPNTVWCLLAVVGLTVAISAWVVIGMDPASCQLGTGCDLDTTQSTFSGVYLGQAAVVAVAVLAVTSEYDSGTIRTTLAARPGRWMVFGAKAAVVAAVVAAAAVLAVAGSFLAGRTILPGHGFTPAAGYPPLSLGDEATRRAFFGTVLYLGLVALLSFGLGTAIRHTGGAIGTVLAALYVLPVVSLVVNDPVWQKWITRLSPMTAGVAVQTTKRVDALPIGPWAAMAVLAGYAAAALLAGAVLFRVRDA